MLGVALADDASHAVAFHNLAVLADRLDAAANFHRALRSNGKNLGQDFESNGLGRHMQGMELASLGRVAPGAGPVAPQNFVFPSAVSLATRLAASSPAQPTPRPWPRSDRSPPSPPDQPPRTAPPSAQPRAA